MACVFSKMDYFYAKKVSIFQETNAILNYNFQYLISTYENKF